MPNDFQESKDAPESPPAQPALSDVGRSSISGEYGTEAAKDAAPDSVISDLEQAEDTGDVGAQIREIPGVQSQEWQQIENPEDRLTVLQDVEATLAESQGRPSIPVGAFEGKPNEYGAYDPDTNSLAINGYHLRGPDVRENVKTIAHEGRHAYQAYAIENPGTHANAEEVAAWAENMQPGNYIRPEEDFEAYAKQPVEVDARAYEEQIEQQVYGGQRHEGKD